MSKGSGKSFCKLGKDLFNMSLNYESVVRSLFLKVYCEQMLDPFTRTAFQSTLSETDPFSQKIAKNTENQAFKSFRENINSLKNSDYYVFAMCHNRDVQRSKDDLNEMSIKKPHWHVLIYRKNGKRFRVRTALNLLKLQYDGKKDAKLWDNRGAETVRNPSNAYMYLFHKTDQAIADGKEEYDFEELATNAPKEVCEGLEAGYKRAVPKANLKEKDWQELEKEAKELGLGLGDWQAWLDQHLTTSQKTRAQVRVLKDAYQRGLQEGISQRTELTRCSILIWGKGNEGKTYTTAETLKLLGLNVYQAVSGSGKYDLLKPSNQAMTFDDVNVSQARNVFDNKPVLLYKRNSGLVPWLGIYAVATTNLDPETWVKQMAGIRKNDPDENEKAIIEAIKSRLYICHIDPLSHELVVDQKQWRGIEGSKTRADHDSLFYRFKEIFDGLQLKYHETDKKDFVKKPETELEKYLKIVKTKHSNLLTDSTGMVLKSGWSFVSAKNENDRYVLSKRGKRIEISEEEFRENIAKYGEKITKNYYILEDEKYRDFWVKQR